MILRFTTVCTLLFCRRRSHLTFPPASAAEDAAVLRRHQAADGPEDGGAADPGVRVQLAVGARGRPAAGVPQRLHLQRAGQPDLQGRQGAAEAGADAARGDRARATDGRQVQREDQVREAEWERHRSGNGKEAA